MPVGWNAYPRSVLPDSHWAALYTANRQLIEEVLDDLARLAREGAGAGARAGRRPTELRRRTRSRGARRAPPSIADYLPPKHRTRYDEAFLRRFVLCLASVGLKMRLPGFHPLGCTAEELALFAMKERAGELLEAAGVAADFGAFDDAVLEDADHELLYSEALDGIEDPAGGVARVMGFGNLSFPEWFRPFNPPRFMHPSAELGDQSPWQLDHGHYLSEDEAAPDDEDGGDVSSQARS